ncbi:ParA family protein, partial [Microcoleus sp. FACHB-1515]|uniref:ParA family protein n=1 Tax=Cyanophyceae TaxID=3028117 RepID=UPI0016897854
SGKGGSCKSTTALSLAAILSQQHKVLVADTDPQGSLAWVAERSDAEFDVVSETDQKVLGRFREIGGYDFLLCDTPPALASEALSVTVKLSDFAVLPSPTSPLDIRELTRTIKQVIAPLGTPYRVLLARVDSRRINEALSIQSQLMAAGVPVFNAIARNFVAHERAIVEGKLITQYRGSGAKDAADDYRRVASELLREMGV